METVGLPAAMSGGTVDVVNPLELEQQFAYLLERDIVGKFMFFLLLELGVMYCSLA